MQENLFQYNSLAPNRANPPHLEQSASHPNYGDARTPRAHPPAAVVAATEANASHLIWKFFGRVRGTMCAYPNCHEVQERVATPSCYGVVVLKRLPFLGK